MPDWFCDARTRNEIVTHDQGYEFNRYRVSAEIKTLEGTMRANDGDWVIKGVKGEIYPCKDSVFRLTYESLNPYEQPK